MPCDSIILNRVELKVANHDVLADALKAMGARDVTVGVNVVTFRLDGASYAIRQGKLEGRGNVGAVADRIKRAYGKQCVTAAARRFGWAETNVTETKTTLVKRY
jgi:hypothetical protein